MKQAREVPLKDIEKRNPWANQISSLTSSTIEEVSSLVNRKTNQKKIALDFFLDPANQEREISTKILMETFSCPRSEIKSLIIYVNTQIQKWRILKNPKGWYVYRLSAQKRILPYRKRSIIKPKQVILSEYIYNYLKQNIGIGFTKSQLLGILPENYLRSRQTIILQKHIQKYCTPWEVVWFFQSWNPETKRYILWTQEQVDEWKMSIQREINKIDTSQKAKIKKWRNSTHWDISKKLKNNEKFIRFVIEYQWQEISSSELIKLLGFKKGIWLLYAIRTFQNRFWGDWYSLSLRDWFISIPFLSLSQKEQIDIYLQS